MNTAEKQIDFSEEKTRGGANNRLTAYMLLNRLIRGIVRQRAWVYTLLLGQGYHVLPFYYPPLPCITLIRRFPPGLEGYTPGREKYAINANLKA